jgi:8-oxo-dGTP pyrophosphatase MutT (NUDIX family)
VSAPRATQPAGLSDDESLVDLRCAVAVVHDGTFLLIKRRSSGDWVLPGGRPRQGESMAACARREVREETGLHVQPKRCAFVLEVTDPDIERRIVELIFTADAMEPRAELVGEPGSEPCWVPAAELAGLTLRPPIAGYLPSLVTRSNETARYLGNLWRPSDERSWGSGGAE